MVFIKQRRIKGKIYYALVGSHRSGNKVRHKFIAHIGSKKPTQMEIKCIENSYMGRDFILEKYTYHLLPYSDISALDIMIKRQQKAKKNLLEIEAAQRNEEFLIGFIHNTNSIEGNRLTEEEVYLLTHDGITPKEKSLKEIYETANMKDALNLIYSHNGEINIDILKELHRAVQKGIETKTLGEFKIRQNYVTGSDHLPTPPVFTEKRIKQLIVWYRAHRRILHPIELASLFHLQFLIIHPFMDGNGRVGRLLHSLILLKHGCPSMIFYKDKKQDYYSAIKNGLQGTPIPFLSFCCGVYIKNLRYWDR